MCSRKERGEISGMVCPIVLPRASEKASIETRVYIGSPDSTMYTQDEGARNMTFNTNTGGIYLHLYTLRALEGY